MLKIGVVHLEDDGEHVGRPHQVGVVRGLLDVSGREGVGALVDVLDEVAVELLQRLESVLFTFFILCHTIGIGTNVCDQGTLSERKGSVQLSNVSRAPSPTR
jgi:hypothetical protein